MSQLEETTIATANSGAAAGDSSATIVIGTGLFEILSLSVSSGLTTDKAQSVRVYVERTLGDGTVIDVHIGAGYYSPSDPFVITNVRFKGPASIIATSFHVDTTSHNINIEYRRIYH